MAGRWGARVCALVGLVGVLGGCGEDRLIDFAFPPEGKPGLERVAFFPVVVPEAPQEGEAPEAEPTPGTLLAAAASGGTGCAGDAVRLQAEATGGVPPYQWSWAPAAGLDDPQSATPVATGDVATTYTATVRDAMGRTAETTVTVGRRALPALAIDFVAGGAGICAGDEARLDASASRDADGAPLGSIAWDLDGDGTVDASGADSGAFVPVDGQLVRLSATDAEGCTATAERTLAVRALPSAVLALREGAEQVCSGAEVEVDGAGSRDADGNPVASYGWDLDGDGAADGDAASLRFTPTHGQEVRLLVSDAAGCSAAATRTFGTWGPPVPQIDFLAGAPLTCAGTAVVLDGSGSRDATGAPVASWGWDVDGDGTIDAAAASTPPFVPAPGQEVRLVVADANGCTAAASRQLEVRALPTPTIAFAAGGPNVCAGAVVALHGDGSRDADGSPVASWSWDLQADGTIDRAGANTGTFVPVDGQRVRLTVTDALGCVGSTEQSLGTWAHPVARIGFASGGSLVCEGSVVELDGAASTGGSGASVVAWSWDVDDDGAGDRSGVGSGPILPQDGQRVRLEVTDSNGCVGAAAQTLGVRAPPVASMVFTSGGAAICAGGSVALDGSGSRDVDGNPVASWSWDLEADGTADRSGSSSGAIVPVAGQTVRLTVTDGLGCTASAEETVSVRGLPTAAIGFAAGAPLVCEGGSVELDGSGSSDVDGNAVASWSWDLESDGVVDRSGANTGALQPVDGQQVRLTVTDALGCTASAARSLATRQLPTARIDFAAGGDSVCAGESVALSGGSSQDADGGPVAAWDWDLDGDGSVDAAGDGSGSFVPADGQQARLTVRDAFGCSASAVQRLGVRSRPLADIDLIGHAIVCEGDTVQLDGSASTDAAGGPVTSWAWELDGVAGTVDSTSAVTHAFEPNGAATLTVTADACTAEATQPLTTLGPRSLYPWTSSGGGTAPPVDIVFVVDNSGSMADEIVAIQNNINSNFSQIIGQSGIDYRVIFLSKHGEVNPDESICISSPLSGTDCNPIPSQPANTANFFQLDVEVGSHDSLDIVLDRFHDQVRRRGRNTWIEPGWGQWLRAGSQKVFVEITDDEASLSASSFETSLFALSSAHFGDATARNYTWHSIVGLAQNAPISAAWEPADPLQTQLCGGTVMAAGTEYQELSRRSGGLRFPICEYAHFDVIFRAIADHVVENVRLDCSVALPVGDGQPALATLEVEWTPSSGGILVLPQVADAAACAGADGYYVDAGTVHLCPSTCTTVQADEGARIDLSGCHPLVPTLPTLP
ncbi:PKD domain-containing protein [Vulgatibacter sp.]|uniref:PKD domain-containing protein n=1 Tax=Vulgatibacter sp. TaxID=1971226 RepID=UPI0035620B1D